MKLGETLRTARKAKGLTLRRIEEATGISNAYLSQLENGKIGRPGPEILQKIAPLYGVSYDLVMYLAGYGPPAAPLLADVPPFIIQAAQTLTDEDWGALRGVVDALVRFRSAAQEAPHTPSSGPSSAHTAQSERQEAEQAKTTPAPTASEVLNLLADVIQNQHERQKSGVYSEDLWQLSPAHLRALSATLPAEAQAEAEISVEEFIRREAPNWAGVTDPVAYVRALRGDVGPALQPDMREVLREAADALVSYMRIVPGTNVPNRASRVHDRIQALLSAAPGQEEQ